MREILTAKSQAILVDEEDYEALAQFTWHVSVRGYAVRFKRNRGSRILITMHREILRLEKSDRRIVDHKNGVKTDNRKSNLRICDKHENGYNQGAQRHNTTGFKGVTRHKKTGKFCAAITEKGRRHHLGLFETPEEAYRAYCDAASKFHGEFYNPGSPKEIRK
jgi:hypothetical protein